MSSGSAATLTVADATSIAKECLAVSDVAWAKRQGVQVVYGNQNWATAAQGVPPSYLSVRDWPLSAGRFFDQRDDAGANPVAVLGQTVVDQLFAPGEDPLGASIRVKNVPFEVIGVLARKGQTAWGQDQDDVVLMPFLTAERRVLGTQILGTVDMIVSAAATADVLPRVEPQIRALLRERHRIPAGQDDDFTVRDLNEIAEASKNASAVMMNLLLSVASVSLLVGGIGIMNIMLVSVTERTREIGVRLAVGARSGHILFQFLVEATALSLVGGAAGIVLGIAATRLIAHLAQWPTLLSAPAAAGAPCPEARLGDRVAGSGGGRLGALRARSWNGARPSSSARDPPEPLRRSGSPPWRRSSPRARSSSTRAVTPGTRRAPGVSSPRRCACSRSWASRSRFPTRGSMPRASPSRAASSRSAARTSAASSAGASSTRRSPGRRASAASSCARASASSISPATARACASRRIAARTGRPSWSAPTGAGASCAARS